MLVEINCDKFIEKKLHFQSGLNTILGDNQSTNSIGKSTLLLIIDFVFGGNTFIESDLGTINELGHLKIDFKFIFKSKYYYFTRSTENKNFVYKCDENYVVVETIKLETFTELLKELYNSNFESRFRQAINPYSRIWKKNNYDVDKPILNHNKEKEVVSVENLVRLFGEYHKIELLSKQIKIKESSLKVLKGMFKENIVSKLTKTQDKKNQIELKRIEGEIESIKENLVKYTLNTEELANKEIIELKIGKQKILEYKTQINYKIARLNQNLENYKFKGEYLNKINDFFENFKTDKIQKINDFHNRLSELMKEEIHSSLKKYQNKEEELSNRINEIDSKIDEILKDVKSPRFIVEKLYDLTIASKKITETKQFAENYENEILEYQKLKEGLEHKIKDVLLKIEDLINNELKLLNEKIYGLGKKTPSIKLQRTTFEFDHSVNTGTGKSYSDLIEFDLALFRLSDLSILIHDSILFKNIEDKAVDEIIDLYSISKKQIFIAIDGITKYSTTSQVKLNDTKVIQLSNTYKLFNRDWS